MTPKEAAETIQATHFLPMMDGVTPQLYYKIVIKKYNDGTEEPVWHYFSSRRGWMPSLGITRAINRIGDDPLKRLIKI